MNEQKVKRVREQTRHGGNSPLMKREKLGELMELDNLHMLITYYGLTSEQFPGQWQYMLGANERQLLLYLIDIARDKLKYPSLWERIKEWFAL